MVSVGDDGRSTILLGAPPFAAGHLYCHSPRAFLASLNLVSQLLQLSLELLVLLVNSEELGKKGGIVEYELLNTGVATKVGGLCSSVNRGLLTHDRYLYSFKSELTL